MSDADDFLAEMLPRLLEEGKAIHNGDPTLRTETWSTKEPVTIFGAFGLCHAGSDEVAQTHRWVASRFSNCEAYEFELVTADVSGDLAYTVGYERHSTSIDGGPVEPHALRVTQIYRREDGEWRIVHRHGDELRMAPTKPSTS